MTYRDEKNYAREQKKNERIANAIQQTDADRNNKSKVHKKKAAEKKSQFALILELQEQGYNIVTCGECGSVIILKTKKDKDDLRCPHCGFTDDYSSFPDLYHEEIAEYRRIRGRLKRTIRYPEEKKITQSKTSTISDDGKSLNVKAAIKNINTLAKQCRAHYDGALCDSCDIEEYGRNEYFGGKAEAYEDSINILRKTLKKEKSKKGGMSL